MSTDVHQIITDKIIAALEAGTTGEWTCPWHRTGGGHPTNAVTKATYRGVNILALWVSAAESGYADPRWASYRQWSSIGAQVRRGEKGAMVVFFKELTVEPDEDEPEDNGKRLMARASSVFNIAQVENAPADPMPPSGFDPVEEADRLIAATGIPVEYGGDQACYVPSRGLVRRPGRDRFRTTHGFYATAFHELGHASGHRSRLDRDLSGRFGTQAYAVEELVAEITSAFVMASVGLAPEPHPDAIAYFANWLEVLRQDKRAIFTAASAASKAAAFLTKPLKRLPDFGVGSCSGSTCRRVHGDSVLGSCCPGQTVQIRGWKNARRDSAGRSSIRTRFGGVPARAGGAYRRGRLRHLGERRSRRQPAHQTG